MAESASYKAAKAIQDIELKALQSIKDLVDKFDTDLTEILDSLDYPSTFNSEARTMINNFKSSYSYQLNQLPARIASMSQPDVVATTAAVYTPPTSTPTPA